MLQIILPFTLVLAPVEILKGALAICFTIQEEPFVVLAICEYLSTKAMWLIIMESALILGAIRPEHYTDTVLAVLVCSKPRKNS